MSDSLVNLLMALFIMSLLSERVAEWLKYQSWFKYIFGIKNTTLKLPSEIQEQQRYFRILKINISVAIIVAIILRADLFYLLSHPGSIELGWTIDVAKLYTSDSFWRYCQIIIGCICTGFFLSFGSKLWHDLLDIVLAFKDAKRQIADLGAGKAPIDFDTLTSSEKEAAIKGAIETFGPVWQNKIDGYAGNGVGKKSDADNDSNPVLQFYVNRKKDDLSQIVNPVPAYVNYGGIRIPTDVIEKPEGITPQWRNPGGNNIPPRPGESVSRNFTSSTGTISLKVIKRNIDGSAVPYLLSCYHVIFGNELQRGILEIKPGMLSAQTNIVVSPGVMTGLIAKPIAQADSGCINDYVDAAIAKLVGDGSINDFVDDLGEPEGLYAVEADDINSLQLKFCGAMSGVKSNITIKACGQTRPYIIKGSARTIYLKDLIELEKCSEEGDSGAPVMDDHNNIIGIIIGADKTSTYVVPIQNIINNLKVFPQLKTKKD